MRMKCALFALGLSTLAVLGALIYAEKVYSEAEQAFYEEVDFWREEAV